MIVGDLYELTKYTNGNPMNPGVEIVGCELEWFKKYHKGLQLWKSQGHNFDDGDLAMYLGQEKIPSYKTSIYTPHVEVFVFLVHNKKIVFAPHEVKHFTRVET